MFFYAGYNNQSYLSNKKLINIAKKVESIEKKYKKDFDKCQY